MTPLNSPAPVSDHDLWVFGYGSLMWRPGFDFIEQRQARLIGEHRALCVYSFDHRGTPEKPGLVLGLDRGGACRGIAFRVEAGKRDATIAYLREREQTTGVYREVMRSVWLDDDARSRVSALTQDFICIYTIDFSFLNLSFNGFVHLFSKFNVCQQFICDFS